MPSVSINLVLDEARIFSGDELNAAILVDSMEPDIIVQEFLAEIRGVVRTGWVNIHTDKIYETEQEFFLMVMPLCQQLMPLKPGRHRFALRIMIPEVALSSFESQFGSVRYTIKLALFTNTEESTVTEIFPFFVVSRSFFDDVPQAIMQPIDYRDEIDFTVCSLPFGTVYLQISLPRTAFCLGESIAARIRVKNATRKTVKDCRLHLLLKTQFEAMSRYEHASDNKLIEQVIDTWPLGRVKSRTEKKFENCCLRIPQTAIPTQNQNVSGITTNYDSGIAPFHNNDLTHDVMHKLSISFNEQGNNMEVGSNANNIITLSYVLRFTALPGIETEIPLVVTTNSFRRKDYRRSRSPSKVIEAPNFPIVRTEKTPSEMHITRLEKSATLSQKQSAINRTSPLYYC